MWSFSGQLCAWCKKPLVHDISDDTFSIIGDECHIHSGQKGGPRYDSSFPQEKIDGFSNLILLCKAHHKIVDDNPEVYTAVTLKKMKKEHEEFVKKKLIVKTEERAKYLSRLTSGADILNVISNILQFGFYTDEPENHAETELLSRFIETVNNYSDIYSSIESGRLIEVGYGLSQMLKEVEDAGFWVFGIRENQTPQYQGMENEKWPTGIIQIYRSNNPSIIRADSAFEGSD